jgi:WD40 repeat protein
VAVGSVEGRAVAVSGSHDGTVRVWDLATGRPRGEPLTGHTGGVRAVAVGSVEGRAVAVSGSHDGTVRVWDLATGRPRGEPLTGHNGGVRAVAVGSVEGRAVAVSGGDDGTVRAWDLATGRPLLTLPVLAPVQTLAIFQRGLVIGAGSHISCVEVPDLNPLDPDSQSSSRRAGPTSARPSLFRRFRRSHDPI